MFDGRINWRQTKKTMYRGAEILQNSHSAVVLHVFLGGGKYMVPNRHELKSSSLEQDGVSDILDCSLAAA